MLKKARDKIINTFSENHGYMSFDTLKSEGVTVLQLRELESEGAIERFARGWYWCNICGYEKPKDHRYIEISLVDPNAVICLDSACYLANVPIREPEEVKFAVPRYDRKKYEFDFPVKRYFMTHLEEKYIVTESTEFGKYRFFARERALYECLGKQDKVDEDNLEPILEFSKSEAAGIEKYKTYIKSVKQAEKKMRKEANGNGGLYEG